MPRWRVALAAGAILVLVACLEPPVVETLDLRILPGGASIVSIGVALRDPADFTESPKVQQRLDSEARALEEGTDAWSARLRAAAPERERDVAERDRGRLSRVVRHAQLATPGELRAFLHDTGVSVAYDDGEGWAELTILPGRSARPTTAQRDKVKSELSSWSGKLASYFAALGDLYDYFDAHPERVRVCLGSLLTQIPEGESLTNDERRLTEAVDDAMTECGKVLAAAPDEPYTFDELSRLVYDPFPAAIRVTVPGTITEREGFPGALDAPLAIPMASFWSAFSQLEGRFVAPDLAVAAWRQDARGDGRPVDIEALAALPRHASHPSADEVRRAIEDRLKPAPVYRVRWTPGATPEPPGSPFDAAP